MTFKDQAFRDGIAWLSANVYHEGMDIHAFADSPAVLMLADLSDTDPLWIAQAAERLAWAEKHLGERE